MLPVVGAKNFHQPVLDIANRTVFHLCILHSAGLLLLINILVVNESVLKISHTSRSFVCTCSACAMVGRLWETKKEKKMAVVREFCQIQLGGPSLTTVWISSIQIYPIGKVSKLYFDSTWDAFSLAGVFVDSKCIVRSCSEWLQTETSQDITKSEWTIIRDGYILETWLRLLHVEDHSSKCILLIAATFEWSFIFQDVYFSPNWNIGNAWSTILLALCFKLRLNICMNRRCRDVTFYLDNHRERYIIYISSSSSSVSINFSSGKSPTVTFEGRTNAPYFGGHVKYLSPCTLPSFFPKGSSYCTPTQMPGWNCVVPCTR